MKHPIAASTTIIAILIGLSAVPRVHGQDVEAPEDGKPHALQAGAWALQFRIGPNLNLGGFQGGIIAAKYHFSDGRALRFGIHLDADVTNSGDEQSRESEETNPGMEPLFQSSTSEANHDGQIFAIGLDSQYIVYPEIAGQVKLFLGAGPMVDFMWSSGDDVIVDFATNGTEQSRRSEIEHSAHRWTIGVQGVLGAEWFVARRISLSGEYGAHTFYTDLSSRREEHNTLETELSTGMHIRTDTVVREDEQSGWSFGPTGVKLGVSLYL